MSLLWLERALWASSGVMFPIGIAFLMGYGSPGAQRREPLSATMPAAVPGHSTDELLDAVALVRDGDLFRADRTPLDPDVRPVVPFTTPVIAHPPLSVRGMIGGPPWSVIVDGIPGTDGGVVIRSGQPVAGISLRAVRGDTIVLQGKDTTWKLAVRHPW